VVKCPSVGVYLFQYFIVYSDQDISENHFPSGAGVTQIDNQYHQELSSKTLEDQFQKVVVRGRGCFSQGTGTEVVRVNLITYDDIIMQVGKESHFQLHNNHIYVCYL